MSTIRKDDWEPNPPRPLQPIEHILIKLDFNEAMDLVEFFEELYTKRGCEQ